MKMGGKTVKNSSQVKKFNSFKTNGKKIKNQPAKYKLNNFCNPVIENFIQVPKEIYFQLNKIVPENTVHFHILCN